MCCENEKLIPEVGSRAFIEDVRRKLVKSKNTPKNRDMLSHKLTPKALRSLINNSDKRTKAFLLLFVMLMCVKSLEGRPSVTGIQSGETKGGNVIDSSLSTTMEPRLSKPKSTIKLAQPDGEVPVIQRYPVSEIDFSHVKTPFIIGAWILSASIAKIAFHMTPKLHKFVPESCLLILVGVLVGVIMLFSTNVFVSPLTPNTFFLYMLPPIILDAGYFMPNRKFFDNLGTILLMAVVGTIFNIVTIGGSLWLCGLTGVFGLDCTPGFLDIFLFASLISAVDPVAVLAVFEEIKVNEVLYIIVFGESLLNDAVTVVMYHMMEAYDEIGVENIIAQDIVSGVASFFVVALGGTIIGIIWGFLLGFITRFTHHVRIIEPIFVFIMAYLSYLNAEMFHMSGILAITFCGIVAKNYVESNISQKSKTTIKYALKMLSNSSETIIFMFLGVASVHSSHLWNTWFVVLTIVFCTVFRTLGVILFSALANRFRLHKLSSVDQFVMSYGGLRGAVAFALVLLIDERIVKQKDMFVTTTIAVIYFTVFLQGITIKPLVEILNVKRANKKELTMNERINERFIDHIMAGIEDIIGHNGNYNLRDKFRRLNDRFIRPLLIRDLESAERKFLKTYSKLTMRDAMAIMQRSPSNLAQIIDNDSACGSFRLKCLTNLSLNSENCLNLEPSFSRYFDVNELDYYPSKRDIYDAEIHHLRVEQYKPYKNHSKNTTTTRPRKFNPKISDRTTKIRFRRYITNKRHLRFMQHGSIHSNDSDKVQNLVTFSDQQNAAIVPQAVVNASSKNEKLDDDEVITFAPKHKTTNNSSSNSSLIEEDKNHSDIHHSYLPWRQATYKKQNSMQKKKLPVDKNAENDISNCDTKNNNVEYFLENNTIDLAFKDNTTNSLDSMSIKSKKTVDCEISKNGIIKTSTSNPSNYKRNGASSKKTAEINEQPIIDVAILNLEDPDIHESNEDQCLMSTRTCKKYEIDEEMLLKTSLLSKTSSEYEEDEEFDTCCEE